MRRRAEEVERCAHIDPGVLGRAEARYPDIDCDALRMRRYRCNVTFAEQSRFIDRWIVLGFAALIRRIPRPSDEILDGSDRPVAVVDDQLQPERCQVSLYLSQPLRRFPAQPTLAALITRYRPADEIVGGGVANVLPDIGSNRFQPDKPRGQLVTRGRMPHGSAKADRRKQRDEEGCLACCSAHPSSSRFLPD